MGVDGGLPGTRAGSTEPEMPARGRLLAPCEVRPREERRLGQDRALLRGDLLTGHKVEHEMGFWRWPHLCELKQSRLEGEISQGVLCELSQAEDQARVPFGFEVPPWWSQWPLSQWVLGTRGAILMCLWSSPKSGGHLCGWGLQPEGTQDPL